jgi:PAS domain S-box-containing protein
MERIDGGPGFLGKNGSEADIATRLRESEARCRAFAEATRDGVVIHDYDRIVDANDIAARLFGYTVDEMIGREVLSFLVPEEQAIALARFKSGETHPYQTIGRRRDGTPFPFEICSRIVEYRGKPARVLVLRDLMEQKRTEAALRRSAEEFRAIFESSPVGAGQADPVTGRFRRVNAKFCEMTGYAAEELLALTVADLIHPEDRTADIAEWRRMLRGEIPVYDREKRYLRKDGTPLWVRATVNAIRDAAGRPVLTSGIVQDIDAGKRIQRDLQRAKERAEAAERELARSRQRLSDAIEILPEGLALYDADDRLVLCNSRYKEQYAESADAIVPGVRFEDLLREALRRGQYPEAIGREEEWFVERLASHREPRSSHEQRLPNGRWLRIEERHTADGDLVSVRVDITDLKRRETELRQLTDRLEERVAERTRELAESEARFRSIAETLPYGIVYQDRDGAITWANPAAEQILGLTFEQMRGRTSHDPRWKATDEAEQPLAGDDHPSMAAFRTGSVLRDRIMGVFNPCLREQRWLRVTAVPQFRNGEPKPQGVYTLFGDITEQRRAETALRESEARFRNMADSAPVMIWMAAPGNQCVFVSRPWCEFTGKSVEESLGHGWADCIHPDDRDDVYRSFRGLSPKREPVRVEYRLRRSDGVWRWMLETSTPRHGEDGTFLGYIGSIVDITERRRQEEEVRRLAHRQAAILDALPANVAVLGTDGTILAVNRAWRGFGVENGLTDLESCVGSNYLEVCRNAAARGDADASIVATELKAVLDGRRERIELDYPCHAPGQERWFRLLAAPLMPGRAGGAVVVHLDVTVAKTVERALHQAQKMESIGQLTGGIAHDFNNLLTAVIGNLELLRRHVVENERGARLLNGAIAAAERGATLTQRLLAFARRQRLEPEAMDIAGAVEGMTELLAQSVGPRVRITTAFSPDLWPGQVDPSQFELVLLNLALNARDAMPDGGTLSIAAANEHISGTKDGDTALAPGDYVRIAVADTGTGMPPWVLARATEPFFTTKEVGKGSGLGLAMVHGVAAQSGGTIRIDSTPGQGTTVEIYLPRAIKEAPAAERAAANAAGAPAPHTGARMLVIDDDPDVRDFVVECLRTSGYEVAAAADGAEGLACLERHPFDLVITDFAMPGMSGMEVAAAAKARRPGLPVAVITGYADANALDTSGLPVLRKPFSPDELTACVARVLAARGGRKEAANGKTVPGTG